MEVQNNCFENFNNGHIVESEAEIPALLINCVQDIAKKEGFVSHSVKINKLSSDGGNYLAVLYEIDITGETKNGHKEVNLFVKYIINGSESLSDFFSTHKAYKNEGFVYKELSKVFKRLEKEANVPDDERYKMVKGYEESSSEAIIMENLSKKGFKTCDRIPVVPLKFVELSVQQLAKFHGLGFAMKIKMPNYYERNIASMKMTDMIKFNEEWNKFYNNMAETSMKNLRADLKKKAEIFVTRAPAKYQQYFTDTATIQTMCHGDFRTNNILMKELDGEVVEIVPVDMQIVHHGCPANDFMYFIYGCTDRHFRNQHLNQIIELYYDTLTNYLKYYNINVADVYPRSKFDAALKDRADMGLIIALGFYPLFFASEDNHPDLSEDIGAKDFDIHPQIVRRIEEIIEETTESRVL